jgi:hypothetical protein
MYLWVELLCNLALLHYQTSWFSCRLKFHSGPCSCFFHGCQHPSCLCGNNEMINVTSAWWLSDICLIWCLAFPVIQSKSVRCHDKKNFW